MRQDTIAESVYVIGAHGLPTVKIGRSYDLPRRLRSIQLMCPIELAVLWSCHGGRELERALHTRFAACRSHGEWFRLPGDPVASVEGAVADLVGMAAPSQVPAMPSSLEPHSATRGEPQFVDQDVCSPLHVTPTTWLYLRIRRAFGDDGFTCRDVATRLAEPESAVRSRMRWLLERHFLDEAGAEPGAHLGSMRRKFTARRLPEGAELGRIRVSHRELDALEEALALACFPSSGRLIPPLRKATCTEHSRSARL
ncbi:GIY-YIG nuclease family protein [Streptomyces sp. NPDC056527]|uniref:GIY-YIG nuclease family protein n=1 Tax=Streptomyces sp. NPDC056527 TaxID=3345853 RepID=UPI0036A2C65F